jgi:autotransporter-associated beta strand protein
MMTARTVLNGTATTGDFANLSGSNVVAATTIPMVATGGSSATNYLLTSSLNSVSGTINSLKIAPSAASQAMTLSGILYVNSGGLLFTGSNSFTITGSTLRTGTSNGSSAPLIIQDYSTGTLTIGSIVAAGNSAVEVVKAGPGTTVFTAANSYSCPTFIDGGILNIKADTGLGSTSAALTINGGTLQTAATFSTARPMILGAANGTIDTQGNILTVTGAVSGAGSLAKLGTGTLNLSGANTATGSTYLEQGTLQGGIAQFTSNAPMVMGSGSNNATLDLNGFNNTIGSLTTAAGASGTLLITNNSSTAAAALYTTGGTFSGNITDGSSAETTQVYLTGAGSLYLSGNNTFTGGMDVQNGGTLVAGSNGTALGAGRISLSDQGGSGFVDLNGYTLTINSIATWQAGQDLIGNSSTTSNAVLKLTTAGYGSNTYAPNTISCTIQDVLGSGTKTTAVTVDNSSTGTGTAMILSGNNTFTGGLNIVDGTVQVGSPTAVGAGTVTIGSTGYSSVLDLNGQTENIKSLATAGTAANQTIGNSGGLGATGTGTLAAVLNYCGSGTSTFGGAIVNTLTVTTASLFNNASIVQTGGSTTGVTVSSGALVLSGSNTYTGGSTVNGGTLQFAKTTALPSSGAIVGNAGTLALNVGGTGEFTTSTTASGSIGAVLARATWNAGSALGIDTTNASGAAATYAGVIAGAEGLNKLGAGSFILTGANTYTGITTVSNGTLKTGVANAIANTSALSVAAGATFDMAGLNQQVGALSSTGTGTITTTSGSPALTVNQNTNTTFAGTLSGAVSLTKQGTGNLNLNGTDSYTGTTTVSAGTLQLKQLTAGPMTINGGKVLITNSGGTNPDASVISASNLPSITSGSLDLTDNGLVITGATTTTEATIASMLSSHAITSSVVTAHSSNMTIAYDFASNVHLTFSGGSATWGGQSITTGASTTDLLIYPTLYGDANMDGSVNSTDVSLLIPNLGKTSGQTWGGGDFNGDAAVNSTDVSLLIPNLGKSVSGLAAPNYEVSSSSASTGGVASPALVPEPASLALLALGGLLVLPRRRRQA